MCSFPWWEWYLITWKWFLCFLEEYFDKCVFRKKQNKKPTTCTVTSVNSFIFYWSSLKSYTTCHFTFELDLSILYLYEEYIFNNSSKMLVLTIALLMIPHTKLSAFSVIYFFNKSIGSFAEMLLREEVGGENNLQKAGKKKKALKYLSLILS